MSSLQGFLIGAMATLAVVLIVCVVFVKTSEKNTIKFTETAFSKISATPSIKEYTLWIDPEQKKWAVAKESADILIHNFADIDKVELSYAGESVVVKNGFLYSASGESVFESEKSHIAGNLYVHIFVKTCPYMPMESILLNAAPLKANSAKFHEQVLQAEKLIKLLSDMKNYTFIA